MTSTIIACTTISPLFTPSLAGYAGSSPRLDRSLLSPFGVDSSIYTPLLLLHATSSTYPCALDTAASLFPLRLLGLFTFLKTLDTIGRRNASNVLFFCALYSTWCFGLCFSPPLDHYLVNKQWGGSIWEREATE